MPFIKPWGVRGATASLQTLPLGIKSFLTMSELKNDNSTCKHQFFTVIDLTTKTYFGEKPLFVCKCLDPDCRKLGQYCVSKNAAINAFLGQMCEN